MALQGNIRKIFSNILNLKYHYSGALVNHQQHAPISNAEKEKLKQLNIPEIPKKPASPFLRFLKAQYPIYSKENPEIKFQDVVKKLSEVWNTQDPTMKAKLSEGFKEDLEKYNKLYLVFQAGLTNEQQAALKEMRAEKVNRRKRLSARNVQRKFNIETNRPKRAVNYYNYFLKDIMTTRKESLKQAMEIGKTEWPLLSDEQKQKYIDQGIADKNRYAKENKEWEAKLIKEGKFDLISSKKLIAKADAKSKLAKSKGQTKDTKLVSKNKTPKNLKRLEEATKEFEGELPDEIKSKSNKK